MKESYRFSSTALSLVTTSCYRSRSLVGNGKRHPSFEQKGTDSVAYLRLQCGDMEKERQFDGKTLDDLMMLVERYEQLRHSKTAHDEDSNPKTTDPSDAG